MTPKAAESGSQGPGSNLSSSVVGLYVWLLLPLGEGEGFIVSVAVSDSDGDKLGTDDGILDGAMDVSLLRLSTLGGCDGFELGLSVGLLLGCHKNQ